MTTETEFVQAFVDRFPVLRPDYDDHVEDMGELLPHVIFGVGEGFTDRIVDAYLGDDDPLDWRSVLMFFEEHFDRGDRGIDEVLVTSFLDRLPWSNQPGYDLVDQLPEQLRTRFDLLRPTAGATRDS
ncbi:MULTISPECIES: hypothetical protein [Actinoplanes]|uniref:DUF7674 family protein n=1 Tax=Actinoplanes TaxID=1865 RepID=UPI0005F2A815|nr:MULTISPECIES: hypothetical protein [Actinoplanes]GLY02948.1 hypothetical protein Acsp01_33270 [Actinoplanes sp. NBRC 101535]